MSAAFVAEPGPPEAIQVRVPGLLPGQVLPGRLVAGLLPAHNPDIGGCAAITVIGPGG